MLISLKTTHPLRFPPKEVQSRDDNIQKNNGGKIARESSKIREKLSLGTPLP